MSLKTGRTVSERRTKRENVIEQSEKNEAGDKTYVRKDTYNAA